MATDLSFNEAFSLLHQGKLLEKGWNYSVLTVIEPIDYNMSGAEIFFEKFSFVFRTTSKIQSDRVLNYSLTYIQSFNSKSYNLLDIDDFQSKLREISKYNYKDNWNRYFNVLINSYLSLIYLNSSLTENQKLNLHTFSSQDKNIIYYWCYAGIETLDPSEIIKKYGSKISFKNSNTLKNSKEFLLLFSEIEI